jgi:hypothetical protein
MNERVHATAHGRHALLAVAVLALVLVAGSASYADYSDWHYSTNVDVNAGAASRVCTPVELAVNFTAWLQVAGGDGSTLDLDSIRVAEYSDAARTVLVGELPSQFDPGSGFDAATNAVGEVVWILGGDTAAHSTRYFTIYYDVVENGGKTPANYTTALSWDPVTKVVETSGFRATYGPTSGMVRALESKLTDTPQFMWNSDEADWWRRGHWHTTFEDGTGWINDWGPEPAAYSAVAGPVRVTVTSVGDEGRVVWTLTRKYYAGSKPTPYWKASIVGNKKPGSPGHDILWLKRIAWNNIGASPRTLVPTAWGGWATYNKHYTVLDYGADGGVGIAASGNFIPNSGWGDDNWRFAEFDCWGESWRLKHYPIVMDYAFAVHNGTNEFDAVDLLENVFDDYNTPLVVVVQGAGTVTGIVTDAVTGLPVQDAIVRVKSGGFSATTYSSATGAFSFVGVPTGTAYFSVKADRYLMYAADPMVAAGSTVLDVQLEPAPFIDLRSTGFGGQVDWLLGTDTLAGGPVNPPYDDFSAVDADEFGFLPMEVPGNWDVLQGITDNIYGWYRTHVQIPSDWAGKNLRLRDYRVDDVDTAFFNGVKIGQTGQFPPESDYRNGFLSVIRYSTPRNYWVPAELVTAGSGNTIAMRVYDWGHAGGIEAGRPILEVGFPTAAITGVVSGPLGPIAGATVSIPREGSVTTGQDGSFGFPFVAGDVYMLTARAFGHVDSVMTIDVPDTGSLSLNIALDPAGTIGGTVTREGVPLGRCRVVYTGPTSGSVHTEADGSYLVSVAPGDYTVVFNALNVIPAIETVAVEAGPVSLDVDLEFGLTPLYDGFAGNALDMDKWELWNMEPHPEAGNSVVTVAAGIAQVEVAPQRGGMLSRTYFPTISTHEVIFPRRYVGPNQIFNLYGGAGEWGNFVEMANEGMIGDLARVAVYGTLTGMAFGTANAYPMAVAMVRTGQKYDFYINGQWVGGDSTAGVPGPARLYLYGYEWFDTETIAFYSSVCAGIPVAPTPVTLEGCRTAATGAAISVGDAVVTASFEDAFWVQNADRSAGIKVMSTANPLPGTKVDVVGRIVRMGKEAAIQAVSVASVGSGDVPAPVAISNRTAAEFDKPGATSQGLLVTVFGTCTGFEYDEYGLVTTIYIDDGSGLPGRGDGIARGMAVKCEPEMVWFLPSTGQFVTAVGVLTVTPAGSMEPIPAVRLQDISDLRY